MQAETTDETTEREQLADVVAELGITAEAVQQKSPTFPDGFTEHRGLCPITHTKVAFEPSAWTVTLNYQGRKMTAPFYMGSGHSKHIRCSPPLDIHRVKVEPPTAADVLYCLASDAEACEQDFDDWCNALGFDSDSRKAEATYRACQKVGFAVKRLLGAEVLQRVRNAEHWKE